MLQRREGEREAQEGRWGPGDHAAAVGMWLLQLRSSDLGPRMGEELVRMTVTLLGRGPEARS